MRVYIAHRYSCKHPPYNGDVLAILHSIGKASQIGIEVANLGCYPFVPHLDWLIATMDGALGETLSKEYYYKSSMEFLKVCDAMIIVDPTDVPISTGVTKEYEYCKAHGIPVFMGLAEFRRFIQQAKEMGTSV